MPDGKLFRQLLDIAQECRRSGGRFVVNDRVDLALAAGAAGVHLGQEDLPAAKARNLLGPDAVIGLSTHNLRQFEEALDQPVDYIAVGPVFATATKTGGDPPLGCGFIKQVRKLTRLPLVAIGGINPERAGQVWEAGADSAAVISDVVNHADPARRVREYMERSKR